MTTRLNLSDAVDDIAPPPPPCFRNFMEWTEYLKSAAAAQNDKNEPKALLAINSEPRINPDFDFCGDCTPEYRLQMVMVKRCNPKYLKEISQ